MEAKRAPVGARGEAKPAAAPAAEKSAPAHGSAAAPAHDPRPKLKTVKLGEGRRRRRDYNPVERAPIIPSSISIKEPDQEMLDRLEAAAVDPGIRAELDADHAFAQAVSKLNRGELESAESELLAFAGEHPRHTAADNALYLAGLIREHNGDCAGALALFGRAPPPPRLPPQRGGSPRARRRRGGGAAQPARGAGADESPRGPRRAGGGGRRPPGRRAAARRGPRGSPGPPPPQAFRSPPRRS